MSNKKTANKEGKITTIKLLKETKHRIEKLREHKRESYDDILKKILYVLNTARDSPENAKKILEKISFLRQQMLEEEKIRKENLKQEKQLR
jgi:hypothetical protein